MTKRTAAYYLPDDLIEAIKQEGPDSASGNLERIVRDYFYRKHHRKPTQAEVSAAIQVLADLAKEHKP